MDITHNEQMSNFTISQQVDVSPEEEIVADTSLPTFKDKLTQQANALLPTYAHGLKYHTDTIENYMKLAVTARHFTINLCQGPCRNVVYTDGLVTEYHVDLPYSDSIDVAKSRFVNHLVSLGFTDIQEAEYNTEHTKAVRIHVEW